MNSFYLTPYWMKQEDWGGGGQPGKGQDQSVPISYGSHCIHVAFLFI